MRLRHALPFAAALLLLGCNDQTAGKSARAPIPPSACPPTPACVPVAPKAAAAKRGKATVHRAAHRKAHPSVHRVAARKSQNARLEEGLAGGPPTSQYRRYRGPDIETQAPYAYRRYGAGGYQYGALPPPRDWRDEAYDERDDVAPPPPGGSGYYHHRHHEEGGRPESRSSSTDHYSSHESGGAHRQGGYSRGGTTYDYDDRSSEDRATEGFVERRSGRDSAWIHSERRDSETTTSTYREHSTSGGPGPCCAAPPPTGAAGFDRNGYLTWPGKVPALP